MLRDVKDGVVSIDAALADYGVVIDGTGVAVDISATDRERSKRLNRAEQT